MTPFRFGFLRLRIAELVVLGFLVTTPASLRAQTPGMVIDGHARFTVITPNLIRIEYAPDGKFIDLPSWFAVNRQIRDTDAKITMQDGKVDIDTGAIHLAYHDNGQPINGGNLSAEIKKGDGVVTWKPGAVSTGNLGGTARTLDGAHGPMPLGEGVLSRDGWYLLNDSHSDLFVGDWIQARPKSMASDCYLFGYGNDYRAALRSLFAVGGPVPLPRKYVLGVWYSRYWPYTSDEFKQIVQEYQQHDFPLDMLVMDMDWHPIDTKVPGVKRGYANEVWTGYTWNKKLISDPVELLTWLHGQGLHVTLNDHPADGIQPNEEMYPDFMHAMGQDPASGTTIRFDAGDKHYLDMFYQYSHLPREKEGVDFWWLDWQQYPMTKGIPDLTNLAALNYYNFQRTSQNGQRGQSFSRWAGWGDHRYPIQFSGDASCVWSMLAFEVPFTSTAGNVGAFFWSHDIGGHTGPRIEESYTRWCQFGAFTAALRSHSTRNASMDRRPWTYPDWAEKSMQASFQLRSKMMPYIYTSIWQSTHEGVPFVRPLYIDHPEQEDAYHNGQEYTFGDNLLVAPIASPGVGANRTSWQAVWFPDDDWYNFFTGEKFTGPSYAVAAAGIDTFPLFVRGGVPLPMQPYTPHPGTAPLAKLALRCYPGRDGVTGKSTLYEDDGVSSGYLHGQQALTPLSYVRNGDNVTIIVGPTAGTYTGQPASRQCIIELPCTGQLTSCSIAAAQTTYDSQNSTNVITLPEGPITEPISVTIGVREIAPEKITQRAVGQRIAGLLGTPAGQTPPTLDKAPPELQEAYAAAEGVALIPMNTHPYLFSRKNVVRFFDNHASASVRGSTTVNNGTPSEVTLTPGQVLPEAPTQVPVLPDYKSMVLTLPDSGIHLSAPWNVPIDASGNIASQAKVEVSSGDAPGAVDGMVDGYPTDPSKEWSTRGHQKAGAWIKLTWPQPVDIDRIALYDRPNPLDQVTGGTLEFSDGSKQDVGTLPNDATSPAIASFPKKTVQWVKFTVTAVGPQTGEMGLSEIAVFKAP